MGLGKKYYSNKSFFEGLRFVFFQLCQKEEEEGVGSQEGGDDHCLCLCILMSCDGG